jgi:hypothetical protein
LYLQIILAYDNFNYLKDPKIFATYLDQLALCCLESDDGHLAGQRVDLLHQEGQPGSTGLPVFQLVLLKIDR